MRIIESDLNRLREKILAMGSMAESAIAYAMQAVLDRDRALSEQVIAADDAIDRLENEIDKLATDVMVLRQLLVSGEMATVHLAEVGVPLFIAEVASESTWRTSRR